MADGIETTIIPKTYVGDGTTINVNGNIISAVDTSKLGEVKTFMLSLTGAVTKATLNASGWAICDGTDTATQVTNPTITGNTPDLRSKFLRHSANETTGGTDGADTHVHTLKKDGGGTTTSGFGSGQFAFCTSGTGNSMAHASADLTGVILSTSNIPAYYDICYFVKVK